MTRNLNHSVCIDGECCCMKQMQLTTSVAAMDKAQLIYMYHLELAL